jgi:hypothetical protein
MQTRASRTSALPYLSELVATPNGLPFFGQIGLIMGIDRYIPTSMAHDHYIAVTSQHVAKYDLSIRCRQDGRAPRGGNI